MTTFTSASYSRDIKVAVKQYELMVLENGLEYSREHWAEQYAVEFMKKVTPLDVEHLLACTAGTDGDIASTSLNDMKMRQNELRVRLSAGLYNAVDKFDEDFDFDAPELVEQLIAALADNGYKINIEEIRQHAPQLTPPRREQVLPASQAATPELTKQEQPIVTKQQLKRTTNSGAKWVLTGLFCAAGLMVGILIGATSYTPESGGDPISGIVRGGGIGIVAGWVVSAFFTGLFEDKKPSKEEEE